MQGAGALQKINIMLLLSYCIQEIIMNKLLFLNCLFMFIISCSSFGYYALEKEAYINMTLPQVIELHGNPTVISDFHIDINKLDKL
jgi:hypothetical protein